MNGSLESQMSLRLAPLKINHHYHRLLGNQVEPNQSSCWFRTVEKQLDQL